MQKVAAWVPYTAVLDARGDSWCVGANKERA